MLSKNRADGRLQRGPTALAVAATVIAAALAAMSLTSCSAAPVATLANPVATEPAATTGEGTTADGATPPVPAETTSEAPVDSDQSESGGCILTNDQVGQAVQGQIADESLNFGGSTLQGLTFSWSGCSFETEDGERYTVGRLENTEVFDGLSASASAERIATVAGLGDEAFFSRDDLFVVSGGETVAIGVDGAGLEPTDIALLVDLARSLLAVGGSDARCDALPSLVPAAWQPGETVLRGGGGTITIAFDSCSVAIAAVPSASVTLRTAIGRGWFDEAADAAPDIAFALPGIGDEAFALDDKIFVLVSDTGFVVGLDDIDAMASDTLQALAATAAEALFAS